jgi:hypothetical protein
MSCFVIVFGSMPIWRRIAASDVSANQAQAQTDPPASNFYTFFTTLSTRGDVFVDLIEMGTSGGHHSSLLINKWQISKWHMASLWVNFTPYCPLYCKRAEKRIFG